MSKTLHYAGLIDKTGRALSSSPLADMVQIFPGTFISECDTGTNPAHTTRRVVLTQPFWLGKYLVTRRLYHLVMNGDLGTLSRADSFGLWPSHADESISQLKSYSLEEDRELPQLFQQDQDAFEFCDRLNEHYQGHLPEGYCFFVPSEAQWEYACHAGTTGKYYFHQDGLDEQQISEKICWTLPHSNFAGHPVGLKTPNPWGLFDMLGNAWELCSDFYIHCGLPAGEVVDPLGDAPPPQSEVIRRVIRGGSCYWGARCDSREASGCCRLTDYGTTGVRLALIPLEQRAKIREMEKTADRIISMITQKKEERSKEIQELRSLLLEYFPNEQVDKLIYNSEDDDFYAYKEYIQDRVRAGYSFEKLHYCISNGYDLLSLDCIEFCKNLAEQAEAAWDVKEAKDNRG